ncbi:hypothetical protein QR680_014880 [Steinernema hermaphroditum]|uniref:Uncharacterized protein n=1 Tax=Steinernema hermaphroditum TaxID=289476 RepID=A0AA39IC03_9BILA|nr:hypothetical protein QR680_014880 [Steinernema hermaphroditum]
MITFVIALFSALPVASVDGRLLYAQAIFRHGDRAPSKPYPNDPYGVKHWPNGWSQLTEKGKNETRELGTFIQNTYLSGQLIEHHSEVHVRSTTKKRAIQSAENMLTGLFHDADVRSNVTIKTNRPHWEDQLLKPNSVKCDRYDVVAQNENRKFFAKFNAKYSDFFTYVSRHTGWNVSMENIGDVFNAVYRETVHGLKQPAWLSREFHANRSVYDLVLELKRVQRLVEFNSPLKAKLRAGYLLGDFVRKLEKAARGESRHKLVLYSSHDATLTALLYNMMVNNDLLTPYAAAVVIELHEDSDGDHFVRVFYRNDTSAPPYQLQVPGCLYADCPLELFVSVLEPRIYRSKQAHLNACRVAVPFEKNRPVVEGHTSHFFLLLTSTVLALIVMLQGVYSRHVGLILFPIDLESGRAMDDIENVPAFNLVRERIPIAGRNLKIWILVVGCVSQLLMFIFGTLGYVFRTAYLFNGDCYEFVDVCERRSSSMELEIAGVIVDSLIFAFIPILYIFALFDVVKNYLRPSNVRGQPGSPYEVMYLALLPTMYCYLRTFCWYRSSLSEAADFRRTADIWARIMWTSVVFVLGGYVLLTLYLSIQLCKYLDRETIEYVRAVQDFRMEFDGVVHNVENEE